VQKPQLLQALGQCQKIEVYHIIMKNYNFQDRRPQDRPILCVDGKLRWPKYVTKNMIEDKPLKAIKAYGAFI